MIFIYLQPFIQLEGVIMICYQIIFKELCTQAARRKPPNISMHFLSTVLCTFLNMLIKEFVKQSRASFVGDHFLNHLSDQDRISPYNIDALSSRQVMRIKKNIN